MANFPIEQALYQRAPSEPPQLLARSLGFLDDWRSHAEHLIGAFGERPVGVACPGAVFAQPLRKTHVVVVRVADQDPRNAGYPTALGFHVLIIPRDAYTRFLGDPFLVSERLPPSWEARGELPTLSWPAEPLPPRTVEDVRRVLQRVKSGGLREDEDVSAEGEVTRTPENSESPALLGGVQVLVDGGKLVFERSAPDTELLRGLWALLPTRTRTDLWPASYAFSNALQFDAVVVPHCDRDKFPGYTEEEQAAEYPAGNYELNLQTAAEAGDQRELDALFGRRSWNDTWRLALTLLVGVGLVALAIRLLEKPPPTTAEIRAQQAAVVAGVVGMHDPLNMTGVWPQARAVLQALEKRIPSEQE